MKIIFVMGALAFLAACGAQGDPLRPTANLGVNFDSGGMSQSVDVGASNANMRFSVGAGR